MSLSTTTNKIIYQGNGYTTQWSFSFPVLDADHLGVILTDAGGLETVVAASAYAVTGIGAPTGGSVTYPLSGAPIPNGTKLTLVRTVPYTQDTVLSNQGGYYPEVVERRFDEIYMALQQLEERLGRASLYAISNPANEQSNLSLIQQLQPMNVLEAQGDLLTHDGSAYRRLPRGGATQVLGGGTDLVWREAVMPMMHIHGLTYSRNAANAIDIASGGAMSEDGTDWLSYAGAAGVAIDVTFGTGAGALDTGTISNADYWIHLVKNVTTGTVKPLASLSRTAPTMPMGYSKRRVFGWLRRAAGGIVDFRTSELAGGGISFEWKPPTLDVNAALGTSIRTDTLRGPVGIPVRAHVAVAVGGVGNAIFGQVWNPDAGAAGTFNVSCCANNGWYQGHDFWLFTNASGQISAACNYNTSQYYVSTLGFELQRR
ncbi:MAG: hypothetical protein IBJ17_05115 [Reyranella sp.]|nr:hypothetical protein [Reyranella sp.]